MAFAKLVPFDRLLGGAVLPGQQARTFSERELAAREEAAYRRGVDAACAQADRQIVELRADMQELGDGVLKKLAAIEPMFEAQLREALPALAVEIARRLLAGYEPPAEVVARLCREALEELSPECGNLELLLSPRDAALLGQVNPQWLAHFPGISIRAEPALAAGDCQVRSRFGLTDARLRTKLTTLEQHLLPA